MGIVFSLSLWYTYLKRGGGMPMPVCTYLEDARTCYEEVSETCYKLRRAFFGKSVLCPCGDGPGTAFHRYFRVSFGWLCLQELVCVDYVPEGPGVSWLYRSAAGALSMRETKLPCHGSIFDSWCQSFFDACDVVATMPPDSIFAECLTEIVDRGKDFLLFGHISHKEDPIAKWLGVSFLVASAACRSASISAIWRWAMLIIVS